MSTIQGGKGNEMTRKNKYVSVQETRAQVTREKLLKAALKLVNQYGMKYLTVRNVCDAAGLSTGSFYNLFSGKDELIAYYLKHVFFTYKKEADTAGEHHSSIEKTLLIYRFYIQCCKEAGLEFVSALYSGNTNPSFNFLDRSPEEELVLDRVREYIEQGKEKGEISPEVNAELVAYSLLSLNHSINLMSKYKKEKNLAYNLVDKTIANL